MQVLFTDVKEAPAYLHLIKDDNSIQTAAQSDDKIQPVQVGLAALLNPTVRFLRFGYLYNERTSSLIKMSDALSSADLRQELNREENNIYTLKYRPLQLDAVKTFNFETFVKDCVQNSENLKPYLECSACEEVKVGEKGEEALETIKQINQQNFAKVLNQNKLTVIAVFARKCQGCRELEPQLPALKRMLEEEIGHKNVGVVKMDIFNEVHFLKHVEKTPSFLLHERKGNFFWDLSTSDFTEITKTADRIHKKGYRV